MALTRAQARRIVKLHLDDPEVIGWWAENPEATVDELFDLDGEATAHLAAADIATLRKEATAGMASVQRLLEDPFADLLGL